MDNRGCIFKSSDRVYIPGQEADAILSDALLSNRGLKVLAVMAAVMAAVAGVLELHALDKRFSGVAEAEKQYGTAWSACNGHWRDFNKECGRGADQDELLGIMEGLRACLAEQSVNLGDDGLPKGYCTNDGAFLDPEGDSLIVVASDK